MVPWGIVGGNVGGTVVSLVGHGSPEDLPWYPWDFGMGRTVVLWWPWLDIGIPKTYHGPVGSVGGEGRWVCGGLERTWYC